MVAQVNHWHGFSISHASCTLSTATRDFPEPFRSDCKRWNRSVRKWLQEHPQVGTVFVSQHTDPTVVVPPGKTKLGVQITGYERAWKALPKTVTHLIVIRDSPVNTDRTFRCVTREIVKHTRRPGMVCAVRRSVALERDSAVSAVLQLDSKRYQSVDLTPFFCSPGYCYPVIGGVLVHKDVDHLTSVYATTLGPFLERAVSRLVAAW